MPSQLSSRAKSRDPYTRQNRPRIGMLRLQIDFASRNSFFAQHDKKKCLLCKLPQESDIVLEKQLQIIHTVF